MEEKHDPLNRFFDAACEELPAQVFTRRVMDRVGENKRRRVICGTVICLGALAVAWFLAPYLQPGALLISLFPNEVTLPFADQFIGVSPLPLFFILELAATGYFLLSSE